MTNDKKWNKLLKKYDNKEMRLESADTNIFIAEQILNKAKRINGGREVHFIRANIYILEDKIKIYKKDKMNYNKLVDMTKLSSIMASKLFVNEHIKEIKLKKH